MTDTPDMEDLRRVVEDNHFGEQAMLYDDSCERLIDFITSPEAREVLARQAYRSALTDAQRLVRSVSRSDQEYEDAEWRQHVAKADALLNYFARVALGRA